MIRLPRIPAWLPLLLLPLGAATPAAAAPEPAAAPAPAPAAKGGVTRVDPTFWWVGMKNPELQLLVYGPGIGQTNALIDGQYAGVSIVGQQKLDNPNYLVVNLRVEPSAQAGKLPLSFTSAGQKKLKYQYELRARNTAPDRVQGINSTDFIYFLMPDRFSNGNPKNDVVKGLREHTVARDTMYARHGGDLQGIINHFDYLKAMGVTAIWPTPVTLNDMPRASYHGYALTDFYQADPRYGTTEEYAQFVQKAHQNGLKVIHDVVLNHIGSYAQLQLDPPAKDWVHQWPSFTRSNYNSQALNDPYRAQYDTKRYNEGWFDTTMPDVNQANPLVARYMIQNFIWWVEYTGLDGYRIDTYPYSDPKFLMDWGQALLDEYPKLGMFGEAWVGSTAQQAFFARNIFAPVDGFKSNLPGVLDFQSQGAIQEALRKDNPNATKLYDALQGDWMYEDATRNVVFMDNHDMSRVYSVIGEDLGRMKMGYAWLLTTRGIPQLYYGTEILMKNFSNPDGKVREDFPGGFPGDKVNKFTAAGRTAQENEAFNYVSKLGLYRRSHPVLQTGKLMQFIPQDGVYTYFRYDEAGNTVMVMMNTAAAAKTVDGARFAERLAGYASGVDVVTGAAVADLRSFSIPAQTAWVLELKR